MTTRSNDAPQAVARPSTLGYYAYVVCGTIELLIGDYPTRGSAIAAAERAIADGSHRWTR
jgi:hypothetical protein